MPVVLSVYGGLGLGLALNLSRNPYRKARGGSMGLVYRPKFSHLCSGKTKFPQGLIFYWSVETVLTVRLQSSILNPHDKSGHRSTLNPYE